MRRAAQRMMGAAVDKLKSRSGSAGSGEAAVKAMLQEALTELSK